MKKRVISLLLAVTFVLSSIVTVQAASGNSTNNGVITDGQVYRLELEDIYRLVDPDDKQQQDFVTKEMLWGKKKGTGEQVPLYKGVIKNMITQGYVQHKEGIPKIVNAQRITDTSFAIRLQWGEAEAVTGSGAKYEDFIVKTANYKADASIPGDEVFYIVENGMPERVWNYDETIARHGDEHAHKLSADLNGDGKYAPLWYSTRTVNKDTLVNGGSAYYFGLFDEGGDHKILGFGIAERSKRWPNWGDLNFTDCVTHVSVTDDNGKVVKIVEDDCQNPKFPFNPVYSYSMPCDKDHDFYKNHAGKLTESWNIAIR